jgi:hypothetical protein
MASKIKPKDLHYDSTLPPFLQRLQSAQGPSDGRHERAIARPKRARNAEDDAEDEPTYVDEGTNHNLSKEEYAALTAKVDTEEGARRDEGSEAAPAPETEEGEAREKEKVAAIGAARKRKLGKVVGAEEAEDDIRAAVSKVAALGGTVSGALRKTTSSKVGEKKGDVEPIKAKKKAKKIKLSFNDDEGE